MKLEFKGYIRAKKTKNTFRALKAFFANVQSMFVIIRTSTHPILIELFDLKSFSTSQLWLLFVMSCRDQGLVQRHA